MQCYIVIRQDIRLKQCTTSPYSHGFKGNPTLVNAIAHPTHFTRGSWRWLKGLDATQNFEYGSPSQTEDNFNSVAPV